ncbi:hypothetical protein EJ05DRAFT_344710 [Pseudovirgaria hyperparasitica]|uniref:Uncharacterized protein n=1 Tax=Pseudovirgaria hyperparasitica TaxID=470096 RepID=A0A6A6W969_9PEZI|nr:uncharacterized protein EJ05DRAFT_344710 [Pseudovirgaria hyperparasitica]KAF2759392.1 hypothetical protein EJ05DRAFT_344710 [Pseudovirgaria hyperparasitica]
MFVLGKACLRRHKSTRWVLPFVPRLSIVAMVGRCIGLPECQLRKIATSSQLSHLKLVATHACSATADDKRETRSEQTEPRSTFGKVKLSPKHIPKVRPEGLFTLAIQSTSIQLQHVRLVCGHQ